MTGTAKDSPATCPFCEIIAGRAPGLHSPIGDGFIVALKPLNPVTEGHTLVLPKRHVRDALEDPWLTGKVFMEAAHLAAAYGPNASTNLITSIGIAATQTVSHFHVHVVPRQPDDGLALPWTGQAVATNA